jgi:hypothetical protein
MLWQTGTTGDGAASGYTQTQTTEMFWKTLISDLTDEGPLKNYVNELIVTATNHAVTPYVSVDTGAAWIYGFFYWNTASVDLNLTLPVVGDTGFRVVLRATYGVTRTVRLALLESADGVAGIPALTQTAGTLWEISLASGVVDTNGDIWKTAAKGVAGVTDLREFVHPNIEVEPAMVKDRTRAKWVPAMGGWNITDGTPLAVTKASGMTLTDAKDTRGVGSFVVPTDYASGMTVTAVTKPDGTGNMRCENDADYGACGELTNTHSDGTALADIAVTINERECVAEFTLASAAVGDVVEITFRREGNHANDTVNADVMLLGWSVVYTADS